jgi:hypothetical protein
MDPMKLEVVGHIARFCHTRHKISVVVAAQVKQKAERTTTHLFKIHAVQEQIKHIPLATVRSASAVKHELKHPR